MRKISFFLDGKTIFLRRNSVDSDISAKAAWLTLACGIHITIMTTDCKNEKKVVGNISQNTG